MSTAMGQQHQRGNQVSGSRSGGNQEQANDSQEDQTEDFMNLVGEVSESVQRYCGSRPGVVAGVLFGLGFFCGWKLRPW